MVECDTNCDINVIIGDNVDLFKEKVFHEVIPYTKDQLC